MTVMEIIGFVTQLSGLHAIILIKLSVVLVWIQQCKAECAKLEECVCKLRELLQYPVPTRLDVPTLLLAMSDGMLAEAATLDVLRLHLAIAAGRDPATLLLVMSNMTLAEADNLLGSYRYRGSMLWCHVQTGWGIEGQLLGMQVRVKYLNKVHHYLRANLPASDTTPNATINSPTLLGGETSDIQRCNNGTNVGGTDNQSHNIELKEFQSVV